MCKFKTQIVGFMRRLQNIAPNVNVATDIYRSAITYIWHAMLWTKRKLVCVCFYRSKSIRRSSHLSHSSLHYSVYLQRQTITSLELAPLSVSRKLTRNPTLERNKLFKFARYCYEIAYLFRAFQKFPLFDWISRFFPHFYVKCWSDCFSSVLIRNRTRPPEQIFGDEIHWICSTFRVLNEYFSTI